jgi:hypothetical protein
MQLAHRFALVPAGKMTHGNMLNIIFKNELTVFLQVFFLSMQQA